MASPANDPLPVVTQTPQRVPTPQTAAAEKPRATVAADRPADPETDPAAAVTTRHPQSLAFQIEGQRIVTTIVDAQNNEVVKQIPDEEIIRIAAAIDRLQGFFLHDKA